MKKLLELLLIAIMHKNMEAQNDTLSFTPITQSLTKFETPDTIGFVAIKNTKIGFANFKDSALVVQPIILL
jgi:hypothetical protein